MIFQVINLHLQGMFMDFHVWLAEGTHQWIELVAPNQMQGFGFGRSSDDLWCNLQLAAPIYAP